VRREIREETGLEVGELHVIGAYASAYGEARWTVDVGYRARARSGELTLSAEKSAASWHPLEDLPQLAFAGERSALATLRALA
jgi:ADP-ribose pyrophosphatase YjhB (NUDIX family)